jgi:hypothetical protein
MKTKVDSLIGWLVLLIALIPQAIWSGYVLSVLWGWFISATFHIPELGIPAAIGLSMVVRYSTYQQVPADKAKTGTERAIEAIVIAFVNPALALGFGWIVHLFM